MTTKETGKTSKKATKENEATTKESKGTTKEISLTTKEIPLSLRVHLEGFSDVARAIFKFFWDHREHSAESAAKEFGLTPDGVRYHIKKLKQGNLLHHEGPTKKGRWVFGSNPKGKRGAKRSSAASQKLASLRRAHSLQQSRSRMMWTRLRWTVSQIGLTVL